MATSAGFYIHIPSLDILNEGWQQLKEDVVEDALFFTVSSVAMTIIGFSSIYLSPPISVLTGLTLAAESVPIEFAIICEYNRVRQNLQQELAKILNYKNILRHILPSTPREDLEQDFPKVVAAYDQVVAAVDSTRALGKSALNIISGVASYFRRPDRQESSRATASD